MALQEALVSITLAAAADYSAAQFTFMGVDANGRAVQAGNGGVTIGVLQNKPSALGRDATVSVFGVTKVVAGGTVAAGATVMSDASGAAVLAAGLANQSAGVAITGGAAGELITVLLGTNNLI